MNKEDIIRKLTSRKFWIALVAFITAILVAFKVPDASVAQVSAIVMGFGALISYVLAEGWADGANKNDDVQ